MLEGHFITHTLLPEYRDDSHPVYAWWKFSRGLTAPVFFTISGLIFGYLLLKNKGKGWQNTRLIKGFKRGGYLIFLGYLLQIKLYKVFFMGIPLFTDYFLIFHVLQCIGSSLLLIGCVYLIQHSLLKIPFGGLLFLLGFTVFISTPTLENLNFSGLPKILENALITSRELGTKTSIFPLFPWSGFVLMGGFLGSLVFKLEKKTTHWSSIAILTFAGFLLMKYNYDLMVFVNEFTSFLGMESIQYLYLMSRMGQVFLVIAAVLFLEKTGKSLKNAGAIRLPQKTVYFFVASSWMLALLFYTLHANPILQYSFFFFPFLILFSKAVGWNLPLFYAIGQNTLFLYVTHVILLYGGFLGLPFGNALRAKLPPFYAVSGMLVFVFFFIFLIKLKCRANP